jgi:hypothetical protein
MRLRGGRRRSAPAARPGMAWLVLSFIAVAPAAGAQPSAPATAGAGCPTAAIRLPPGADLATIVANSPEGASFCIGSGLHRLQRIRPKDRQSFFGQPGAIMNGARLLQGFTRDGPHWVVGGQRQRGHRRPDVPCLPDHPRCGFPEAVFVDDRPLLHAASRAAVTADSFFLDYDTGRLFLGLDPTGRRVEASAVAAAFTGEARGVLIAGLVVEKYSSEAQAGAIGHDRKPREWTVRDSEIRLNSAAGLMVGSGSRVLRNRIHGNGNLGVGCGGEDVLFEDNEISGNGHFRGMNPLWEGGGVKCFGTSRVTFRRNRVEANNGIGLWTDFDNVDTLYEGNLLLRNANSGISHEISYRAVIRGNVLIGNGDAFNIWLWGSAIQLQNSREVLVEGNLVVAWRGNGIGLIQQDRGAGRLGPWVTTGNRVSGNVVISMLPGSGRSGAVADHDHDGLWNGGNVFAGNIYHVTDTGGPYWAWREGYLRWAEYRARSGQDADGMLLPFRAR